MADTKKVLQPEYIGDGVYVHDEGFRLALAVNNHNNIVIYMEKYEILAFINYAKKSGMID